MFNTTNLSEATQAAFDHASETETVAVMSMKERLKRVEIKIIPNSQIPYRLIRRNDGVTLGSYDSLEAAKTALEKMDERSIKPLVYRKGKLVRGKR